MKKLSRREFLSRSSVGLGGLALAARIPYGLQGNNSIPPLSMPFGFQIWTIREDLLKDFGGTLAKMAGYGYKTVEMCSPPGYGFTPLMKMTAKEMKKIFDDNGLKCVSSHYVMKELRENLDERIEFAKELGQSQMILSSFGLPRDAKLDDWKKAADELNQIGLKANKGGIQMGFHNHNNEFATLDGVLIYDALMQQFDPEYIKMQFQVAVITVGFKAVDYFNKYPGRFISAHLADYAPDKKTSVPIGKGIVDWTELFSSLKKGGVRNVFAEIPGENFRESAEFLKTI
jgi:sugar phosphate isomerase/epimerase